MQTASNQATTATTNRKQQREARRAAKAQAASQQTEQTPATKTVLDESDFPVAEEAQETKTELVPDVEEDAAAVFNAGVAAAATASTKTVSAKPTAAEIKARALEIDLADLHDGATLTIAQERLKRIKKQLGDEYKAAKAAHGEKSEACKSINKGWYAVDGAIKQLDVRRLAAFGIDF